MGAACSDCKESCDEECDRKRKCYVDQNEVKISAFDMTSYPQGTKINSAVGRQHSIVAELAMPGTSSRSTAATSGREGRGQRLKPQSVSWADGLVRQTGNLLGRFQLQPKASSFSGGGNATSRAGMSFEQQMGAARATNAASASSRPPSGQLYPR
mmetsp:Transcript_10022/g.25015  ORF Transcript_10022/g.25015 Transcript_10022/m.25015 type:complete len:155 (-) Transcript_10022:84-548(-)